MSPRMQNLHRLADQYEANGHHVEIITGLHAHLIVTDKNGQSRYKVTPSGTVKRMLPPPENLKLAA